MTTSVFNAASKWLCYHCKSLNQLQSWECEKCDLPKTCTDSMDKAVSKGKIVCVTLHVCALTSAHQYIKILMCVCV